MTSRASSCGNVPEALVHLVGDEHSITAVHSTVAKSLAPIADAGSGSLEAFRLFPIKNDGFVVGYRFGGGALHSSPSGLFDCYLRRPESSDPPGCGEIEIPELRRLAFRPETDSRFTTLARALDGEALRKAGVPIVGCGTIVAYRPQGRATIRFELVGGEPTWLRLSASRSRGARISELANLGAKLEFDGGGFPRVLLRLDDWNATLIQHRAGIPFSERIASVGDADLVRVARALAGFAHAPIEGLAPHHAVDEAQQTAIAVHRAARLLPSEFIGIEDDLVSLFDAVRDAEAPRLSVIHRDLHDKQIVWSHDTNAPVSWIDTDTLAAGDPALDLANLAVHLELRELQSVVARTRGAAVARATIEACARAGLAIPESRLDFYRACSWLRLAGVYALRSHGIPIVPALLAKGRLVLSRLRKATS